MHDREQRNRQTRRISKAAGRQDGAEVRLGCAGHPRDECANGDARADHVDGPNQQDPNIPETLGHVGTRIVAPILIAVNDFGKILFSHDKISIGKIKFTVDFAIF